MSMTWIAAALMTACVSGSHSACYVADQCGATRCYVDPATLAKIPRRYR